MQNDERLDRVNENLTLIQKKNGLTFGTDAYLLYAYMKAKKNSVALELGGGTGIISLLALSKGKFDRVYAVEIQRAFGDLIERNAKENRLNERLTVLNMDLRELSLKDLSHEVDAVFANPPYMTTGSGFHNRDDEKYIARHEVKGNIADFCQGAARVLKYGSPFYVVYRPDRLTDLINALREASLEPKRMTFVHADEHHAPSLVLVEARKGGSQGLFVTKPLLLKTLEGMNTQDIDYIYENGVFHEQFDRP